MKEAQVENHRQTMSLNLLLFNIIYINNSNSEANLMNRLFCDAVSDDPVDTPVSGLHKLQKRLLVQAPFSGQLGCFRKLT